MANRIPYNIICACKQGDEEALKCVLKHYEPLIVKASKRQIRTADDQVQEIIDNDIRAYIESELVMAIVWKYDPAREPRRTVNNDRG